MQEEVMSVDLVSIHPRDLTTGRSYFPCFNPYYRNYTDQHHVLDLAPHVVGITIMLILTILMTWKEHLLVDLIKMINMKMIGKIMWWVGTFDIKYFLFSCPCNHQNLMLNVSYFQSNEVALDYNAGFQSSVAGLLAFEKQFWSSFRTAIPWNTFLSKY